MYLIFHPISTLGGINCVNSLGGKFVYAFLKTRTLLKCLRTLGFWMWELCTYTELQNLLSRWKNVFWRSASLAIPLFGGLSSVVDHMMCWWLDLSFTDVFKDHRSLDFGIPVTSLLLVRHMCVFCTAPFLLNMLCLFIINTHTTDIIISKISYLRNI